MSLIRFLEISVSEPHIGSERAIFTFTMIGSSALAVDDIVGFSECPISQNRISSDTDPSHIPHTVIHTKTRGRVYCRNHYFTILEQFEKIQKKGWFR